MIRAACIYESAWSTQCRNGIDHERRGKNAPWEALGGTRITEAGNCPVNAKVLQPSCLPETARE
jgi:hypothetical protein